MMRHPRAGVWTVASGFSRKKSGGTGSATIRRALAVVLAGIAVVALATGSDAQTTALRLATVVPDGSIWDKHLKQMGEEWKAATAGRVSLTIFNGGSQGDDPAVLRKMRLGTLHAASLSPVGLAAIDASFNVVNVPFFFDSYEELNAVLEALTPTLRQRMDAKGFVLLNWGHVGWLQIFTKQPVQSVAELKNVRLYTAAGDDRMTQLYKANGYRPVAMAMTDVLTGLTAGLIDGIPASPSVALNFQWYRQTPHMLQINLAPLMGATVVDKRVWNRISDADRTAMLKAAAAVERRLSADVPTQDAFAVALMGQQGLSVTKATGPEWSREVEIFAKAIRGQMVPADIFDLAMKERTAFRERKSAAPPR